MKNDQKNFLLFAVLAALVLFGWPYIANHFFPAANPPVTKLEDGKSKPVANPATDPAADTANAIRDRAVVLRETPRIAIETPSVQGSINLRGGRIDDLVLVKHKETIAANSPPVRLLSPSGTADAYFAQFGWSGTGVSAPPADALWTASGTKLTPQTPVTLSTTVGTQRYQMQISVDDGYMFTVRQSIANAGPQPIQVATYGLLSRRGAPVDKDTMTIQVGPVYEAGNGLKFDVDYKDIDEAPESFNAKGGWLGFTDH